MSLFGSSMMNLLVGSAVSKGASLAGDYFKNTFMGEGSFLSNVYEEYIDPYNPFGTADEVRDASGRVIQKAVASGASQLLAHSDQKTQILARVTTVATLKVTRRY